MEIVALIAGLAFTALGGFLLQDSWRFRRMAVEIRGTVIAIEKGVSASKKRGSTTFYRPVIEYTHRGQTHRFTARVGSSAIMHAIGQTVAVLVSPHDAAKARLKSRTVPLLGLIFLLIGIGLSVLFFNIFEVSAFSIAVAIAVVMYMAIQAYRKLRKHGVESIEDLMAMLKKMQTTAAHAGQDSELITDTAAVKNEVRRQSRQLRWIGPLLLILGLGICVGSAYFVQHRAAFLETARTAEGVVISLEASTSTSDGRTTTTYYPVVRYTPAGGNRPITFRHDVGSSHPFYRRGEKVPVLYDPENPETAMIDEGWMNWLWPGIMLAIGVIFLLAGVFMIRRWQSAR